MPRSSQRILHREHRGFCHDDTGVWWRHRSRLYPNVGHSGSDLVQPCVARVSSDSLHFVGADEQEPHRALVQCGIGHCHRHMHVSGGIYGRRYIVVRAYGCDALFKTLLSGFTSHKKSDSLPEKYV
jgi:hypothetical protein